ncbi:hypothetical protein D9757_008139 [Collybiopsis confluens]|uniref:Uncharacterized protein n=1 Tax=Collybiopsis confluens TaxID=2823264 RepID=A0A8H5M5D0_9AGAR|nr:hypothetical protein D9757_008139 [Collybiopsis confluens]
MFRLSYSLRLILFGLVVISSFTCDGMPAPLPNATSLPKSPAETTPKVAPQIAPPPTKSNVTLSKSTPTKACPVKTPSIKLGKTRSLFRRSGPADASGDITLYHGTTPSNVAALKTGIHLWATEKWGDFSYNYGFYFTDRMKAAGQYVCHDPHTKTSSASIFEYKWAGSSVGSAKIYKFTEESTSWKDFVNFNNNPLHWRTGSTKTLAECRKDAAKIQDGKVMITGPMNLEEDKDLTDNFWQYALIDQESVGKLTLVAVHDNIPCSKFPKGTIGVTDSQGPSKDFPEAVKTELGIC